MPRPTRLPHGADDWDDYLESVFDDLYSGHVTPAADWSDPATGAIFRSADDASSIASADGGGVYDPNFEPDNSYPTGDFSFGSFNSEVGTAKSGLALVTAFVNCLSDPTFKNITVMLLSSTGANWNLQPSPHRTSPPIMIPVVAGGALTVVIFNYDDVDHTFTYWELDLQMVLEF